MANKLIILFSGKKQAGKDTACNFTISEFINRKVGKKKLELQKIGKEYLLVDLLNNNQVISTEFPNPLLQQLINAYSVKVYTFHDPVKQFCIENLGLDSVQCYGSEDDKNSSTHIVWDDLYDPIREKHSRPRRGSGGFKPASGFMTAKEVMDVVENDIFKRLDLNCWARSLYSMVSREGYDLALINGANHPNEITMGSEVGAKAVRLLKEPIKGHEDTLADFPLGEYHLVVDNNNLTVDETHNKIKPHIHHWFEQRRLF